jgi:hypothetical protein
MLNKIKAYLDDNVTNLEDDGLLCGQTVTLVQAAELLVDFVRYKYASTGMTFPELLGQQIIDEAEADMPKED